MTPDLSKLRELLEVACRAHQPDDQGRNATVAILKALPSLLSEAERSEQHRNDLADKITAQSIEIGAANATIAHLRIELTTAREALEPFARIADVGKHGGSFVIAKAIYTDGETAPRQSHWHWSDFERARAALRSGEKEA